VTGKEALRVGVGALAPMDGSVPFIPGYRIRLTDRLPARRPMARLMATRPTRRSLRMVMTSN
jgi:hypothetical protein